MLNPIFSPEVVAYTVEVDYSCSTIRISADPYDNTVKAIDGYGVKDLKVGTNNFNITVTAQNGSMRTYSLFVTRAAEVISASVDVAVSASDTTTAVPVITEAVTTTTFDFTTAPSLPEENILTVAPDDNTTNDAAMKVMGVLLGLVALFFFGFLSGFFIDKRMKRKELEQLSMNGLARTAQSSYPMPQMPVSQLVSQVPVGPPMAPMYMEDSGVMYVAPEPVPEEAGYGYEAPYPVEEPYVAEQYDQFGGLSALTNAAYPDSEDEDYYDQ